MITFAEVNKEPIFDWNAALSKKNKHITRDFIYTMMTKSANWTTCACGNQCSIIPRYANGCPIDEKLSELGKNFNNKIHDINSLFKAGIKKRQSIRFSIAKFIARRILRKIEKRSQEIIEFQFNWLK